MPFAYLLDYWAELGWRDYAKHMGLYVTVAVCLSLLGPFNTYNDPFFWRFSYWTVMLGFFGGLLLPLIARLARRLPVIYNISSITASLCVMSSATLPMTLMVILTDQLLFHWIMSIDSLSFIDLEAVRAIAGPPEPLVWSAIPETYVNVFVVVVVVIGFVSLTVLNRYNQEQQTADRLVVPSVAFLSRLPEHIGDDLIYLQMEDHYLRAVTTRGYALILMRFRDALHEIEAIAGLQVHRSWWVASRHVAKLSRAGRRVELVMTDGTRVPVSASYRAAVDQLVSRRPAKGGA